MKYRTFDLETTDVNGNATFSLGETPSGHVDNVTLCVPGSPAAAVFTPQLSAYPLPVWQGQAQLRGVQIGEGEQVVVSAMGLLPLTQYAMTGIGQRRDARQVDSYSEPYVTGGAGSAALGTSTTQFLAANGTPCPPAAITEIFEFSALTYPPGLAISNFNTALVSTSYVGIGMGTLNAWAQLTTTVGNRVIWEGKLVAQTGDTNAARTGNVLLPIVGSVYAGLLLNINNLDATTTIYADVILSQEAFAPATSP